MKRQIYKHEEDGNEPNLQIQRKTMPNKPNKCSFKGPLESSYRNSSLSIESANCVKTLSKTIKNRRRKKIRLIERRKPLFSSPMQHIVSFKPQTTSLN